MKMNRFDVSPPTRKVSQQEQRNTISKSAYETLLGALAEEQEHPSSTIGVFVANSERRKLKALIERLLCPQQ